MLLRIRKYLLSLLIFSLLLPAVWPLLKEGFFNANDAVWHISRLWQFHLSFSSGQIPVRWGPTLFYGLGYPAFIFNFHLPYYLMEIIYRLGFGLVDSYKIVLGLSFIFSGIFSFLFLRSLFPILPAIVGSLFFVYSPYRFATVYSRGAIGEALAIALVPLIFWFLELFRKGRKYSSPLFAFSIFLLIITHPFIFLMFAPMILLYIILFSKKQIQGIFWFLIGCIASSFAILPYFFERKYLMVDEFTKNAYLGHFPNLFSVFRIPLGHADLGSPFQIGIVNWLVVLIVVITLLKFKGYMKKNLNYLIKLSIIFFAAGIILMGRFSLILWEKLPFLSTILYPWRFINLLVFSSSICAAFLIYRLKNRFPHSFGRGSLIFAQGSLHLRLLRRSFFAQNNLIVALILIISVMFVSRHWWGSGWVGQIPTSDEYYKNYQETTTAAGEFTPKGLSPHIANFTSKRIEILQGQGEIIQQTIENNRWEFKAKTTGDTFVKLSILNFPGWQATDYGNKIPIINDFATTKNDYSGLIVLRLPSGDHKVKVAFSETPIRKLGNYLSLIFLFIIFFKMIQLKFKRITFNKIRIKK